MITKVPSVAFTVSDLARSQQFFTEVLQFQLLGTGESTINLPDGTAATQHTALVMLGTTPIELRSFPNHSGRPIPPDSRSNDLWFQHVAIVVSDIDAAYARLRQHGVQHVSSMPQTLPDYLPAAAGIRAFYFRDPDDHNLELIQFPFGKGDPHWQSKESLFLGIDHTAIAVASTPRSLAFYRDTLGLEVAGESENYGTEQEHLNMVFGAHLQITGLRATDGGIGVEFLDYLAPPGGRPLPADTQITDIWHWETMLYTTQLDALAAKLAPFNASPIAQIDGGRCLTVHDPDGHTLKICQPT